MDVLRKMLVFRTIVLIVSAVVVADSATTTFADKQHQQKLQPQHRRLSQKALEASAFWTVGHIFSAVPCEVVVDEDEEEQDQEGTQGGSRHHRRRAQVIPEVINDPFQDTTSIIYPASGHILFRRTGGMLTCSGTVLKSTEPGLSLVLTAGHCVFDYKSGLFATDAIFIPHADDHSSDGFFNQYTDSDLEFYCANLKLGCWYLSMGIVEERWSDNNLIGFPRSLAFDWGIFVARDEDHFAGYDETSDSLVVAVGGGVEYDIENGNSLSTAPCPNHNTAASGFGYPRDAFYDPDGGSTKDTFDLRYCSTNALVSRRIGPATFWWPQSCGLNSGASGGALLCAGDPDDLGSGKLFSVQSWKYGGGSLGRGYPMLAETLASCGAVVAAESSNTDGDTVITEAFCEQLFSTPSPTASPTLPNPTTTPTSPPTELPTLPPTANPTITPTQSPSSSPTSSPSEDIEQLKLRLADAETQIELLSAELLLLGNKNDGLNTQIDSLGAEVEFLSSENEELNTWIDSLDAEVEFLSSENNVLKADLAECLTAAPTRSPSFSPTSNPSRMPTRNPSASPTLNPSSSPTTTPTAAPTNPPSLSPTSNPSRGPTKSPSFSPTLKPSSSPTTTPTAAPNNPPSLSPTNNPSRSPTENPSSSPTTSPTVAENKAAAATNPPSRSPTSGPSQSPAKKLSASPTAAPTVKQAETQAPSNPPSISQTDNPSRSPTKNPSSSPTTTTTSTSPPSLSPTNNPSPSPTSPPTTTPTTISPTSNPTQHPSTMPTSSPTNNPTLSSATSSPIQNPQEDPARRLLASARKTPIANPNPVTPTEDAPQCVAAGAPCTLTTQCCSGVGNCSPSNNTCNDCGGNKSSCTTATDCCSKSCIKGSCRGYHYRLGQSQSFEEVTVNTPQQKSH